LEAIETASRRFPQSRMIFTKEGRSDFIKLGSHDLPKRVDEGTRTPDPQGHNLVLSPTELHPPRKFGLQLMVHS
jgi:hypothetical protein